MQQVAKKSLACVMIVQKLQYFTSCFHSYFLKSVQNHKKYLNYRLIGGGAKNAKNLTFLSRFA